MVRHFDSKLFPAQLKKGFPAQRKGIKTHLFEFSIAPVEVLNQSPKTGPAKIKIYRVEWVAVLEVPQGRLLPGSTSEEQLGIQRWTSGRDWRATGFYNHWTTYAEMLQLIASLTIGIETRYAT